MIGPDDPVPLPKAVDLFWPAGGMTLSALRTEVRRGNLAVERVGGRYFTTQKAIREMRERCRVKPRVQGSTSASREANSSAGSSSTEEPRSQRDATKATASRLKRRSPI